MIEKLYYSNSHWREFTARVLTCKERGGSYAVTLDRTVFFPEGGGQGGDTGTLDGDEVIEAANAAAPKFKKLMWDSIAAMHTEANA